MRTIAFGIFTLLALPAFAGTVKTGGDSSPNMCPQGGCDPGEPGGGGPYPGGGGPKPPAPLAGTDGAPLNIVRASNGLLQSVSARGKDGVTRTMTFDGGINSTPVNPHKGCYSLGAYINPDTNTLPLECNPYRSNSYQSNPDCENYGITCQTDYDSIATGSYGRMSYTDSSGKQLTVIMSLTPGVSGADYEISNGSSFARITVVNGKGYWAMQLNGIKYASKFIYNQDTQTMDNPPFEVTGYFPEIQALHYFASLTSLPTFMDLQVPLPQAPSGWRYLGDGVLAVGNLAAYTFLAPEWMMLVAAESLVAADMWQSNVGQVQDRTWETAIDPLCAGMRALDALDGLFEAVPADLTFRHAYGCD